MSNASSRNPFVRPDGIEGQGPWSSLEAMRHTQNTNPSRAKIAAAGRWCFGACYLPDMRLLTSCYSPC